MGVEGNTGQTAYIYLVNLQWICLHINYARPSHHSKKEMDLKPLAIDAFLLYVDYARYSTVRASGRCEVNCRHSVMWIWELMNVSVCRYHSSNQVTVKALESAHCTVQYTKVCVCVLYIFIAGLEWCWAESSRPESLFEDQLFPRRTDQQRFQVSGQAEQG